MSEQIGSGPIEADLHAQMNALAIEVELRLNPPLEPRRFGFVLLAFPFGATPGRCNYISNAKREDIKTLLREQLSYFEGMPDDVNARPV